MKPAFFNTLAEIPEADRNDYKLETAAGSPNFNKYVLDLDPQHPVAVKNAELLGEKTTRETQHQAVIQQKDADIQRLTGEVQTAKTQSALPAGHIAIPQTDYQNLQTYRTLGDVEMVKTKVEEHGTLKEQTEAQKRKDFYKEVAEAEGLDPEVFTQLAEPRKLNDLLVSQEITDAKGTTKRWFVKGKDEAGTETTTALNDFAKKDSTMKVFEKSLFLTPEQIKLKVKIPDNSHGDPPAKTSGATAYINRTYKPADKKSE